MAEVGLGISDEALEEANLLEQRQTPGRGQYSIPLIFAVAVSCLSSIQYGYHMSELNAPEAIYSCQRSIPGPRGDYEASFWGRNGYSQCIPLSSNRIGIVTSIFSIGGLLGSVYSGRLADHIGRKKCFAINSCLFVIGSMVETVASSYVTILLGRFVSGLGAGSGIVVTPLYINEVSPLALRGTLGSMNQVAINVGILLTQLVAVNWANDEQWRWILFTGAIVALVNLVGSWFMDESPKWLVLNGDDAKGAKVLAKLRGTDALQFEHELEYWQKIRGSRQSASPHAKKDISIVQYLSSNTYHNSRSVVTAIMVGQQFCGINSIIFYGVKVLIKLFPNSSVAINCAISVLNMVVTFAASFVIDRLGRKPMLLTSVSSMLVASIALGFGIISNLSVLSVLSTFVYVGSFAIGLGPIPFLIISEVTQNEVKGLAQSYGTTMNWLATFLVGFLFPILNEAIGGAVYFLFAAICFSFILFTYYKVPETKGKDTYEAVWNVRDD